MVKTASPGASLNVKVRRNSMVISGAPFTTKSASAVIHWLPESGKAQAENGSTT
jgi:hypothetical protein